MDLPERSVVETWRLLADPAELVLRAWAVAVAWTPSDRDSVPRPSSTLRTALAAAIRLDVGNAAAAAAVDAMVAEWSVPMHSLEAQRQASASLLCFLEEADEIFRLVHPRTPRLAPGGTPRPQLPSWLRRLEFQRGKRGWYATDDVMRMVDRGPLKRAARSSEASFADNLADRFSAICVCPCTISESGRLIEIVMRPVGGDAAQGVPSTGRSGRETVTFVAVAEDEHDLTVATEHRNGRDYVDFKPRPDLEAADRVVGAARACGVVDLLVCPELTVTETQVDRLGSLLAAAGCSLASVLLAGSGLTSDLHADGRSWNEARLMNASGTVLVRQRKVWPFGMARSRAEQFRIVASGSGTGLVMEDVASGTQMNVIDLTEFGRLVILVCQDFETNPLAADLIREYQPDWVLVPILDLPVKDFGWTNNRAFGLSSLSQARFVICNSLTLSRLVGHASPSVPGIGLVVGPREPTSDSAGISPDRPRAFALAVPAEDRSPHHATLTWRDGTSVWRELGLAPN